MYKRQGLNIISDEEEFVHVSGHPGKNEIKEFYSFIQPKSLIPMHGEYLHLKKHLEIAKSLRIEKTNLLLSGDLCQLDLVNKNHKLIDQFVIKKLPVVQNLIIEEDSFINERGKILHNGVVSINLILNKKFDIIIARAVAPLSKFMVFCRNIRKDKTIYILPKGANF